jgi:hypothetical protein
MNADEHRWDQERGKFFTEANEENEEGANHEWTLMNTNPERTEKT